jgi:hypothetical protein
MESHPELVPWTVVAVIISSANPHPKGRCDGVRPKFYRT